MGYISAEEVLLPARFITKTAHLVAVLTVLFDVDVVVRRAIFEQSNLNYNTERETLHALAWASVACFIVEYIGLLLGTSIFHRRLNALYIVLHFVGTILVALFYTERWELKNFIPFFACFSGLPALLELWVIFRVFIQRNY